MKKHILLLTMIVACFLSSCNKYENGPSFTLLSATKRITGTWELKETRLNDTIIDLNNVAALLGDIDFDSIMSGIPIEIDPSQISITSVKMTFEKDGNGNFSFAISVMGFPLNRTEFLTWAFDEEKDNITIILLEEANTFEITRLTNKELWLRRTETQNGETTTIAMKMEKEKD